MRAFSSTTGCIGLWASGVGLWPVPPAPGPAGAPAEHVPFGKLVEVADHGPGVDFCVGVAAVREEAVEHIDRCRWDRLTSGARFIQRGDEKRLAAGAGR